ncbi:hypothetical protein QCA50_006260 [Cerrena zonata]|uniref:Zn(2)-C6 fungal-type domain-containing protein n=1 Tax=Cerrena zonata TaxID=2478898 RepID=A0AAW0GHA8_9APHY
MSPDICDPIQEIVPTNALIAATSLRAGTPPPPCTWNATLTDTSNLSDLLSRHVNKCHASEKPPVTTAPNNRRKGPTAASRATTSKQACDQCVQNSLPCDGCNPCSKCVQRKFRCTYVKFHRQTAPQGPGHPPPSALAPNHPHAHHHHMHSRDSLLSSAGLASTSLLGNDFILAPPPGAGSLGMNTNLYGQSLAGMAIASSMEYPAYPGYAPTTTTGLDQRHSPTPSLTLSTSTRDSASLDGSPDLLARYRNEQLLRSNNGVSLPGIGTIAGGSYPGSAANANQLGLAATTSSQAYPPPSTTAGGLTGLYHDSNPAWQHGQASYQTADPTHKEYNASGRLQFPTSLSQPQPQLNNSAPNVSSGGYPGYHPNAAGSQYSFRDLRQQQHQQQEAPHVRAGSEDSVTNSSVDEYNSGRPHTSHAYPTGSSSPSRQHHQQQQAHEQQNHQQDFYAQTRRDSLPQDGEGGFSSAFGLMSLDDPAVLAGLRNDGAPFFSDVNPTSQGPGDASTVGAPSSATSDRPQRNSFSSSTPFRNESNIGDGNSQTSLISVDQDGNVHVSNHHLERPLSQPHFGAQDQQQQGSSSGLPFPSLPTPLSSKEDLKEFWRQYLKTPLTGPGSGTGFTPFFGPNSTMGGLITPTASGEHLQLGYGFGGEQRPQLSPTRRHSRVASLPSMKTPTLAMNEWLFNANATPSNSSSSQQQTGQQQPVQQQQQGQSHQGMFGFGGIPPQFNLHLGKGSLKRDKVPVDSTAQEARQHSVARPVAQTHVERQMAQNTSGSEDDNLDSYKQAIIARQTHTQLHLAPRTHVERQMVQEPNDSTADDDLNSYKQAVLARKAPTQLHLAPRKRGKTIHSGLLMGGTGSKDLVEDTPLTSPPTATSALPPLSKTVSADGYARPGSSSSSLADAFGMQRQSSDGSGRDSPTPGPRQQHHFLQPPPPPFHLQRPTPSMSPTNVASHPNSSASPELHYSPVDHEYAGSARPTFKRLASQTLGPEHAKRALLGPAGWDEEVVSEEDDNSSRGTSSRGASEGREATVAVA